MVECTYKERVPTILVVDHVYDSEAMQSLLRLAYEGKIRLIDKGKTKIQPLAEFREDIMSAIGDCQAIICRPTDHGVMTEEMLNLVKTPFYIATLSKGVNHIKLPPKGGIADNDKDFIIISAENDPNAASVAELTINLATLLLRPVHKGIQMTRNAAWETRGFRSSKRFEGLTWTAIGSGGQVGPLIRRVLNWGIKRFIIWNDQMDEEKFDKFVVRSKISKGYTDSGIIGTSNLDLALSDADIISIHLKLTEKEVITDDGNVRWPTKGIVNKQFLSKVKDKAILINVARGGLINEEDVLNALFQRKLFGFAADVVNELAEEEEKSELSKLWHQAVIDEKNDSPITPSLNLIITPHIGGATKDATEAIAGEVIPKLLRELGI